MPKRYFTPAQANRTLPLMRRIVADILKIGRALRLKMSLTQRAEDRAEAEDLKHEMYRLLKEIEDIGCAFRDWSFEHGLVDFPSRIEGQEVLLCWRSDEPQVAWYHDPDAGYAGRKPIPAHLLDEEPVASHKSN